MMVFCGKNYQGRMENSEIQSSIESRFPQSANPSLSFCLLRNSSFESLQSIRIIPNFSAFVRPKDISKNYISKYNVATSVELLQCSGLFCSILCTLINRRFFPVCFVYSSNEWGSDYRVLLLRDKHIIKRHL